MKGSGYIKLYREICDNWLWLDKPFSKGQAWIDLLLTANYTDKKFPFRGKIVNGERGTVYRSVTYFSTRWGWSRDKTRAFLNQLQNDGMIHLNATTHQTTITIVNYGFFQDQPPIDPTTDQSTDQTTEPTTDQTTKPQQTSQQTRQQIHIRPDNKPGIYNKDNKDKERKEIYIERSAPIESFFESVWKLYPEKKGKSKVNQKTKQALYELGYEKVKECIDRYVNDKPDWKQYQHGSTFFNGGYLDYLEEAESEPAQDTSMPKEGNRVWQ